MRKTSESTDFIAKNHETVSVVMCTYNGGRYVSQQLDSILSQTRPADEIIIQDDGSADNTWDILTLYANRNDTIKLYRNEAEHGINGNFFSAMRRAQGTFIAVSDQDDIWQPNKLELQLSAIGSKLLCSCHSRPFSNDGSFTYYDSRRPNACLPRMLFVNLPGHTFLFRRTLLTTLMPEKSEMYEVSFYDAALCIAAAAYESIAYVDEPLVDFRRHADARTYNNFRKSLPGAANAIHQLLFTLRHYRALQRVAEPYLHARLTFLQQLGADTDASREAITMLKLELTHGALNFLRLQRCFVNAAPRLFHTSGDGMAKRLRALLYPVMQYYTYRGGVEQTDNKAVSKI